jgi:hypothetical protein
MMQCLSTLEVLFMCFIKTAAIIQDYRRPSDHFSCIQDSSPDPVISPPVTPHHAIDPRSSAYLTHNAANTARKEEGT